LTPDLKTRLDGAVERARKALRGDDMGEIRAAQEELASAFQEAGRSFYAQQQESSPPPSEPSPAGEPAGGQAKADDVVEADYEIVDEGKKS
jgi:molecular chaperone DnaK